MNLYKPPYTITDEMLRLVASISEKVGHMKGRRELEQRPHLRRNNRIKSIHSSLKIEANSLALDDVRDVISGRVVLGDAREILEVKNAYAAYESMHNFDPYKLEDLQSAHKLMMDGLIPDAGAFRHSNEGVFAGDKCIFIAPPPELVPEQMSSLFTWMNQARKTLHPLIISSVFHYEFVFIHPFSDGNGRMARLWQTLLLYQWQDFFAYIPIESRIEQFQEAYYDAIARCHVVGSADSFVEFILTQIDKALDEVSIQAAEEAAADYSYVDRMMEVMEYDIAYSSHAIMERLGLKSKETFRKNYMNPAINMGYVRMTEPDKPNSRNQKYVKG